MIKKHLQANNPPVELITNEIGPDQNFESLIPQSFAGLFCI
jgi:hypothetical protein